MAQRSAGTRELEHDDAKSVDMDTFKQSQVEGMLDYIRANLNNIRGTWGALSPQYEAATQIMQQYFNENIKKLDLDIRDTSLEDLIAQLSLDDTTRPN